MKKKIFLLFFETVLAMIICACSPASKKEIIKYVKGEHYGEAELIRTDKVSDDEIIYNFKDCEYGFMYQVSSKVVDISFDATKFGETETKNSDFNSVYYDYVTEQIGNELSELEASYGVDITTSSKYYDVASDYHVFANIYYLTGDLQTAPEVSKAVNDLYKSYDLRDYWKCNRTYAYDEYGNKIGEYDLANNIWMTPDMEEDDYYIKQAHMLNPDAVYTRKDEKKFKDTGISMDDVTHILGMEMPTENSIITYYYFEVDGKEFFLADIVVNPMCRWYTNYQEIFGK